MLNRSSLRTRLLPLLALVLTAPALLLAGCQTPGSAPTVPAEAVAGPAAEASAGPTADLAAIRTEIAALTASYQAAAQAGDNSAITALYADDAVLHPAGKPAVRGRAAVDAYLAAQHARPEEITYTTVDVIASEAGDLVYEVGTAVWPDGPGKYLTVYRRTPGGWRIVADTWSHDAPPAAPAN